MEAGACTHVASFQDCAVVALVDTTCGPGELPAVLPYSTAPHTVCTYTVGGVLLRL